jgi:O-antigen/teichoic acid export membrane protein
MNNAIRLLPGTYIDRLITHLRVPLYRNGYALVISSIVTSGLGVVFWAVAARFYSTETLGLNSAAISAMMFLSYLAQLNMTNALNRFLPKAGRATVPFIISAYGACTFVAVAASLIFLWNLDRWAPDLAMLGDSPAAFWSFVLATVMWCLFALQDGVLVGIRQSTWIPIENTAFALVKLVMLALLAWTFPLYGVFIAWTFPVVVFVLVMNILIFRRLIPRHVQNTQDAAEPIPPKSVLEYVTGDYLSSLIWLAVTTLLPLIVVAEAGATANAYFYLAWTISYSLYLVSRNMGMSLIAEAAADPSKLLAYSYRTLVQSTRLVAPIVFVLIVGAPYFLLLFGESYASEGSTLLRLLCLGALPGIVTSLYVSIARVQRRAWTVVFLQTIISLPVLILSYIGLRAYGITGIGYAWLGSQTIVAALLAAGVFRSFGCMPISALFVAKTS